MDRLRDRRRIISAVAILIAAPLYVLCGVSHVCMDGHMEHPPYPPLDWVNDSAWVILFVAAGVLAVRSSLRLRKTLTVFLSILLVSRLVLGSGCGFFFVIELPLLLTACTVAVVGLFGPGRDWSAETPEVRRTHRRRVARGWGVAVLSVVGACVLIWAGFRVYDWVREARTPQIVVAEKDLPFERDVTLKPGQAVRVTLPDGRDIAFWWKGPGRFFRERLFLAAGERPFRRPESIRETQPDGSEVWAGWDSYIRDAGCLDGGTTHEYIYYIDKYRITARDEGEDREELSVKIRVRPATEEERLFGRAEIDHYLKMLKSEDAQQRLAGLDKLQREVGVGSRYAKGPGLAEAVRALLGDDDDRVREKAAVLLGSTGDGQYLLGLVTPEPKGEWRTADGARSIASWAEQAKLEGVSKHVLTFFDSADDGLRDFALTYFLVATYPPAKPHVLRALADPRAEVRASAVGALGSYSTRAEFPRHLKPMLQDPSTEVLHAALLAAGSCNESLSGDILPLLKSDDEEVREMAAYALDCCQDPKVVDPLLEATHDPSPKVRAQAAVSLGRIGTPRAFDRLIELLGDESAEVRTEAVNGLRWLKDNRSLPVIRKLLEKEADPGVRDMIKRTLRELGG